ncbi:unnamed protein product [Ranitomeya imitator]|uniref:Uncharacterized protein n=1 Tax=Ranitomeya imitator TaxID=111125 RepID=A0ABN9LK71_9NEOB|nr:unnamed protein product [Ranitomeya imitator]
MSRFSESSAGTSGSSTDDYELYNSFPFLVKWLPGPHKTIFENFKELNNFITKTFTKQKKELDVNDQRNLIDAFLAQQQEVQ